MDEKRVGEFHGMFGPDPNTWPAPAPRLETITPPPPDMSTLNEGRKDDSGKLRYSLIPWSALASTVEVLMFGAAKYGDHNWRMVPDLEKRYGDALLRHGIAFVNGDWLDPESGLPHLAHCICCAMFILANRLDKE